MKDLNQPTVLSENANLTQQRIKDELSKETGWDRIRRMYNMSEYGVISPELSSIIHNSTSCIIVAGAFGALHHIRKAKEDYFRKNIASTFESQHLARRNLIDTMTLSGIKGALQFSLKYGSFSSIYMLATMTAANYNNKVSVWEHIASGAILGGVYRIKYGLKGFAAAGCLGGFLGLLAGGAMSLFMHFSGISMDDFRYWLHDNQHPRRQKKKND